MDIDNDNIIKIKQEKKRIVLANMFVWGGIGIIVGWIMIRIFPFIAVDVLFMGLGASFGVFTLGTVIIVFFIVLFCFYKRLFKSVYSVLFFVMSLLLMLMVNYGVNNRNNDYGAGLYNNENDIVSFEDGVLILHHCYLKDDNSKNSKLNEVKIIDTLNMELLPEEYFRAKAFMIEEGIVEYNDSIPYSDNLEDIYLPNSIEKPGYMFSFLCDVQDANSIDEKERLKNKIKVHLTDKNGIIHIYRAYDLYVSLYGNNLKVQDVIKNIEEIE